MCDSEASVSCLSSETFDSIQTQRALQLTPSSTHLKAANQLPIETRGTVTLPVQIGSNVFHHKFHVLAKSKADCLIGLGFLDDHICDPLFLKKTLQIAQSSSVPLYHKTFKIPFGQVFRVIAQDTVSIPAGHSMIIPACIPDWKRSPVELVGTFEPHQKFNGDKDLTAPDMLFTKTEDIIPLVIENSGDSPITVYKHTKLGSLEVISREQIQNIGIDKTGLVNETKMTNMIDEKYDLNLVKVSIDHNLSAPIQSPIPDLVRINFQIAECPFI